MNRPPGLALELEDDPGLTVEQVLHGKVGRVSPVGVHQRELGLRVEVV